MNNIQIFSSEQFGQIRAMERNGEPWFVAIDVCKALDIDSTATRRLDDDEKAALRLTQVSSNGVSQDREVTIVSEPGLYGLVLGSRKKEAKDFKRWIKHEVLPSIRKHGMYATPVTIDAIIADPDFGIKLLTELKAEQERNAELKAKVEADKPKVLFADSVVTSKKSILIGELAKILRQNGFQIGQQRLFQRLRDEGFLCKAKGNRYNKPTQYSMELGLFEIKESTVVTNDGRTILTSVTKVTPKGQIFFINRYLSKDKSFNAIGE